MIVEVAAWAFTGSPRMLLARARGQLLRRPGARHRSPATLAFYRARLKKFVKAYNARELATLTSLEIDDHLARAGEGLSDSTRHHDAVALQRLQQFALDHNLLAKPVFGKLEKPRVGQRHRLPTPQETAAILSQSSPEYRT